MTGETLMFWTLLRTYPTRVRVAASQIPTGRWLSLTPVHAPGGRSVPSEIETLNE